MEDKNYTFPPLELLDATPYAVSVPPEEIEEDKKKIHQIFHEIGVGIEKIDVYTGSKVTLYAVLPTEYIESGSIVLMLDAFKWNLLPYPNVRVYIRPNDNFIYIETAHLNPSELPLRHILESKDFKENNSRLPMALGCTLYNNPLILDLAEMRHLLIVGSPGQGKSVLQQAIITSLLYSKRPDELKFVMIDTTLVEFTPYESIADKYIATFPGQSDSIVTDMNHALSALTVLNKEMERRFELLVKAQIRTIHSYNKAVEENDFRVHGARKMPYLVVMIDDWADIIAVFGKEAIGLLRTLIWIGYWVGIHVVVSTQRPSSEILPHKIRNYVPTKIAFKMNLESESNLVLGYPDAAWLIGRGDMLVQYDSELIRSQGAFIDYAETQRICEFIANQPYIGNPVTLPTPPMIIIRQKEDPLYQEAKQYALTQCFITISMIQRKFYIGYNRAGRIIDTLVEEGIIVEFKNGKGFIRNNGDIE